MNEIKLGTNLELTVSELVEEYSQLLTNEIVTSFQKQGRFTGNTKKSVIKALENKFESVEYVAGAGKRKAKFILTNYNGNVEDYNAYKNNGGSIAYDWTEVDNMIRNQLSKYSNDEHYHSTSSIIHNSLKIEYISDAVSNFYDHLTGFKTLENGEAKYNIKNLQEIFEWFERYHCN